jgi:Uma2 family endonuclease
MCLTTVIVDDVRVVVPEWVDGLDEFRRWTDEPDFPEKGNIWWLHGGVWADMSKEQVFTHVLVKTRITSALDNLVTENDLGLVFSDGLRVTNLDANLSGKPDATFVSNESRREGRVRFIEGMDRGYTEIIGAPDMVLEVVSDSSETKDLETLREDYFSAGVREYWLVDARGKNLVFEILRRNKVGFVATRKQSGWMKSSVFGKSFRLAQELDQFGDPKYRLEMK